MSAGSVPVAQAAEVAEKWGELVADRGFAQIPNYLLYLNQFLDDEHKLSPIELMVLVQIVASWWRRKELPFPSMATLAVRSGVSERQVQRAVARLEKGRFLKRVKRRNSGIVASNAYDLSPLVEILETVARAFPNAYPRRAYRSRSSEPVHKPSKEELAALDGLLAEITLDQTGEEFEKNNSKMKALASERAEEPMHAVPKVAPKGRVLLQRPRKKPETT